MEKSLLMVLVFLFVKGSLSSMTSVVGRHAMKVA